MVLGVYCIRDKKSTFMSVTVDQNDNVAVRNFAHAVMNSNSVMTSHKEDFELYRIGDWDNESGRISSYDVLSLIAEGGQFNA